nr:MAG TPA: hypothetical protein [Caudoviricetes sp.]
MKSKNDLYGFCVHRVLTRPLNSSVRGYLSSTGILLWIKRDLVL